MNRWRRELNAAIARERRPFCTLGFLLVGYLLLAAAFSYATSRYGLLAPSGSPNVGVALLGAIVLAGRCAAIFLVPLVAVYRLAALVAVVLRKDRGPLDDRAQ